VNASPADAARPALAGRVVLVVGAHGGLGSEAALACAEAGAKLVLLGRRVPKLKRLLDRIESVGGEASAYPLDLEGATPDDYAELADRIEDGFGRLDGILHCAAHFPGLTPLPQTDPAEFARAVHVNLTAPWWLTQACLPLLSRAGDAAVVFAIDDLARTGGAYWGGYGIAQHGLAALVAMLQAELGSGPVRVSALQPGPMRTSLRARAYAADDDRIARDAADYADACVTLLSARGAAHRGRVWAPEPA
jgi:NAD(P)-dependent dehydrogenase (short-subunit alcohol dehydrogenase family)